MKQIFITQEVSNLRLKYIDKVYCNGYSAYYDTRDMKYPVINENIDVYYLDDDNTEILWTQNILSSIIAANDKRGNTYFL